MSQYESPTTDQLDDSAPRLRYMHCFQYVFDSPNWVNNLLMGSLFALIPIVGPLVLLGYQFTIIEALHRNPQERYPDLDTGQFSNYLTRGIWPFLVSLIAQVVVVPLLLIVLWVPMICGSALGSGMGDDAIGGICVLFSIVLAIGGFLLFSAIMTMTLIPMFLSAGLTQELGPAFNFGFIKDFVSRTWKEMVLGYLFFSVAMSVLMTVGLLLCCVGMYPAMALAAMANAQWVLQLYEIYLARGGMKLPIKAAAA